MEKNYEVRVFRTTDIDCWSETKLRTDSPEKAVRKWLALQKTKKGAMMSEIWAKDREACKRLHEFVLSPESDVVFAGVREKAVASLRQTARDSLEGGNKDFRDPMGFGDVIPGFEVG